jgi:hypothetical protein
MRVTICSAWRDATKLGILAIIGLTFSPHAIGQEPPDRYGPDCQFEHYGVTYLGWNIGDGQCFVSAYDEDDNHISSSIGACDGYGCG